MSFEELIKRIAPKLKGIVYKFPKHFNAFDGDDLYEEAVAHLWADYQAGKLADKTESYILQSCYFFLKNHVRKVQDKLNFVSMNAPVNEAGGEFQDALLPEEKNADPDEEDIDDLMEEVFMNVLTRQEKEVAFFYLQGWTTRKIGERLGLSHVSVVKLQEKIREKCKRSKNAYKGEEDEED
ncbi:MAG: sigma-70 family RNA polymerase sigma factor [Candidatus Omnitrophica bacterium]|nr:sigma-70 family RNA polymerase sigma factor [Candidatus Omnitrophota bacterium]